MELTKICLARLRINCTNEIIKTESEVNLAMIFNTYFNIFVLYRVLGFLKQFPWN